MAAASIGKRISVTIVRRRLLMNGLYACIPRSYNRRRLSGKRNCLRVRIGFEMALKIFEMPSAVSPTPLTELQISLHEEWRLLHSAVVDHFMESTVTRCKLCIQVKSVQISC
ncbi:hypothetical protein CDAR_537011 [Caerostris darwini]|uniref:Uncharacterized protein n=1 Tax=Caerostris darwini TaxID=1538125 RepID=A0AAV4PK21_9ARAC|nr:hypothetical protein CDAR_537011 [Caerostris darwini]